MEGHLINFFQHTVMMMLTHTSTNNIMLFPLRSGLRAAIDAVVPVGAEILPPRTAQALDLLRDSSGRLCSSP